jgi:hypothetical protein
MKISVIFSCFIIVQGFIHVGCTPSYSLRQEYRRCEEAYFEGSRSEAKVALIQFLDGAEKRSSTRDTATQTARMNYPLVLGLSWLRLSLIYRSEKDDRGFQGALAKAITYYDQLKIPDLTSNPKYQSDKEASLLSYINQLEAGKKPRWQQANPTSQP